MLKIDHRNVFCRFSVVYHTFLCLLYFTKSKNGLNANSFQSVFFDIIRLLPNNFILILLLLQLLKIFHSLGFEEFVDATQVFFYSLVSELVNLGN